MREICPYLVLEEILAKVKSGMPKFNFEDDLDPKFIPRAIPWGLTGDKPYFEVESAHIWFDWSFLAKNKAGMFKFYFRADLDSKIHPQKDSFRMNFIYE